MSAGDSWGVDMSNDLIGGALIFLRPIHSRLGVAVLHRLVRPWQFERSNLEPFPPSLANRLLEHGCEHEAGADDRDDGPRTHGIGAPATNSHPTCPNHAQARG